MARSIAFSLCRYSITQAEEQNSLSADEQMQMLTSVRGKRVAYRKQEPSADDETTFLFRPRQIDLHGVKVLTWQIGDHLKARLRAKYNQRLDEIEEEMSSTDEVRATRFVAVPSLGALAIDDRTGDRYLGARSAAARMKLITLTHAQVDTLITFAGSSQDVDKALTTWSLDHFTFTVRPSNPHPPKLSEKLDEYLREDNIGKFRGDATPANNEGMRVSEKGLIREVASHSEAGYGQFGASGTTPSGLNATLSSPKFDNSKDKNLQRQAENRVLKIHITQSESAAEEDGQIVKALIELYGV